MVAAVMVTTDPAMTTVARLPTAEADMAGNDSIVVSILPSKACVSVCCAPVRLLPGNGPLHWSRLPRVEISSDSLKNLQSLRKDALQIINKCLI